jgi:hypothetical protein
VAGLHRGDSAPQPGVARGTSGGNDGLTRLEVDGEVFELRPDEFAGTHYTWSSGPNRGYGFSVSPTADIVEEHEANIRGFLSMVDPGTGYIEED